MKTAYDMYMYVYMYVYDYVCSSVRCFHKAVIRFQARGTNAAIMIAIMLLHSMIEISNTSTIPVRWPGQSYGFTLLLIFKYCGGIGLY